MYVSMPNGVRCGSSAGGVYSREQRAKRACLHAHLATAARVKYPAALQRYKFDAPLLAAGSLTHFTKPKRGAERWNIDAHPARAQKHSITGQAADISLYSGVCIRT